MLRFAFLAMFAVCVQSVLMDNCCRGDDEREAKQLISEQAQTSLHRNVTVTAWMPGDIASVEVHEGAQVDPRQPLVHFDNELASLELRAAESAHQAARVQAENDVNIRYAERTLDVSLRELQQSLAANAEFKGTVSDTEIDRLQLVVDQARLAIEQAKFEQTVAAAQADEKLVALQAAQARLRKHVIESPQAGMVAEVLVQPGQRVETGEPLIRIIDVQALRIECLIHADIAHRCQAEDVVVFQTPDDQEHAGVIDFVSPEVHPVTGQVRLIATVYNADRQLRPGIRGKLFSVK